MINDDAATNTAINVKATVTGTGLTEQSKQLTDYVTGKNAIQVIDKGRLFIANREVTYDVFRSSGKISEVHDMWVPIFEVAEKRRGVVYYVDKYDRSPTYDASSNPVAEWDTGRNSLDYSSEATLNTASNLIDSMIHDFIANSGGVSGSFDSRDILLIGDDRIIPHYRAVDPTSTVTRYSAHSRSGVFREDSEHGYVHTDIIYPRP